MIRIVFFFAFNVFFLLSVSAQTKVNNLRLEVTTDRANWEYRVGETPIFKIKVTKDGEPVSDINVKYTLGLEKMEPQKVDSVLLVNGEAIVHGYNLKTPGFLRLTARADLNGKIIQNMATAAFEPLKIQPTVTMPSDFNQYWNKAKAELAEVPMHPVVEPLEALSTETVAVYQVALQNIGGSKVYGVLCVPKKAGKYPAALQVPGAGVRGYKGDVALAERGVITLQIGIHGIPPNLSDEVYTNLSKGALNGYPSFNMDNKDLFYYKRVYLGCIRALDFLVKQEHYDGQHLAVYGGSQGGALAIVTAGLDQRVNCLYAYYPALSDVTGYLYDRAGGWPHYFSSLDKTKNNTEDKLNTVSYYDVVNFAKQLTIPGFYSWGFNDEVCPPTSMYAAYNSISAPKSLSIYKETGHFTVEEQRKEATTWLLDKLF